IPHILIPTIHLSLAHHALRPQNGLRRFPHQSKPQPRPGLRDRKKLGRFLRPKCRPRRRRRKELGLRQSQNHRWRRRGTCGGSCSGAVGAGRGRVHGWGHCSRLSGRRCTSRHRERRRGQFIRGTHQRRHGRRGAGDCAGRCWRRRGGGSQWVCIVHQQEREQDGWERGRRC
ncbi:hypothetical protein BU23DRAFT_595936, partial [Bimuria novae-zelandiae CBS 107.79]